MNSNLKSIRGTRKWIEHTTHQVLVFMGVKVPLSIFFFVLHCKILFIKEMLSYLRKK